MTATPSTQRLTRAEAAERGLIPHGHTWDEGRQAAIPIGNAVLADRLERPLDLAHQLEGFKRTRETLLRFIRDYLEEAEYDAEGRPIEGKVGDFYKVPGSDHKALTKRGASKINQLFRWSRGAARLMSSVETAEFCSATVEVPLVDQYGRTVGAGVAACNTAEKGFTGPGAVKKYGGWGKWEGKKFTVTQPPDLRAALNDVMSRAVKRAGVQATIAAAAIEEVFTVAREDEPGDQQAVAETAAPRLPESPKLGALSGKLLADIATDALADLGKRIRAGMKNPQTWQPIVDAIDEELERRRPDEEGEGF